MKKILTIDTIITAIALATVLAFGTVACTNPAGPSGTEVTPPTPPAHEHTWGATVWGNTQWGDWTTKVAAGAGVAGLGQRIGTETGVQTCTTDGTTQTMGTRTYVAPVWVPAEGSGPSVAGSIEAGEGSESDGHWTSAQNTHLLQEKTIPANHDMDKDGNLIDRFHTHNYDAWVDTTTATRWVEKSGDASKEIEEKEQEEFCSTDNTKSGTKRWVATGNERPKEQQQPSVNFPTGITPKNVDTLHEIEREQSGAAIHNVLGVGSAIGVIEGTGDQLTGLLPQLSTQAKNLATFFGVATGDARFTTLQGIETEMKGTNNMNVKDFLAQMNEKESEIINTIFTSPAEFNKYLDAYNKYNTLITRDWMTDAVGSDDTVAQSHATDAAAAFKTSLTGLTLAHTVGSDSSYSNTRGAVFNIPSNHAQISTDLETAMKNQIIAALGATGKTNSVEMATALVAQMQDRAELEAFVTDLTAEGLDTALNYTVSNFVAQ
jgi:hypothetical protein